MLLGKGAAPTLTPGAGGSGLILVHGIDGWEGHLKEYSAHKKLLGALTLMAYFSRLSEPWPLGNRLLKASYFYRISFFLSDMAKILS